MVQWDDMHNMPEEPNKQRLISSNKYDNSLHKWLDHGKTVTNEAMQKHSQLNT